MKTNNKNYTLIHVSCFSFFVCVVLVVYFVLSVLICHPRVCHLTAGVTSLSKILGLGQTPVELYM